MRDKVPSALSFAKSHVPLLSFLCQVSSVPCPLSFEIASILLTFNCLTLQGTEPWGSLGATFMFLSSFTLKAKHWGQVPGGSLQDWTYKMGSAFVCNLSGLKRRQVGRSWGCFQNAKVSSKKKKGAIRHCPQFSPLQLLPRQRWPMCSRGGPWRDCLSAQNNDLVIFLQPVRPTSPNRIIGKLYHNGQNVSSDLACG